jgi:hypothetical protein
MKKVETPKNAQVAVGQHDQAGGEPTGAAPDFTPEQWTWLKARTREFEKNYRPTRSLIEGL